MDISYYIRWGTCESNHVVNYLSIFFILLFCNRLSKKMMEKIKLFDNEGEQDDKTEINTLCVLSLFKNNETFPKSFLPKCKQLEETYSCKFVYFFLENNSTDNTPIILKRFIDSRKDGSKLFTLDLPPFINKDTNFERTDRLAFFAQ